MLGAHRIYGFLGVEVQPVRKQGFGRLFKLPFLGEKCGTAGVVGSLWSCSGALPFGRRVA